MDRVIPVRVELITDDVHACELHVADLDPFLVRAGVVARVDLQAGAGRGRRDQLDDHLKETLRGLLRAAKASVLFWGESRFSPISAAGAPRRRVEDGAGV
jgi:hypothetical protein